MYCSKIFYLLLHIYIFSFVGDIHAQSLIPTSINGVRLGGGNSDSVFTLGMSTNSGNTYLDTVLNSETVSILGTIIPDPEHLGETSDIFVVFTIDNKLLMIDSSDNFVIWNGAAKNLVPFRENVILENELMLELYEGTLETVGSYRTFAGYMPDSDALHFTPIALKFSVTEDIRLASSQLAYKGLYVLFDQRGAFSGYWPGQMIQTINDFDSLVGQTVAEEISDQLDLMIEMGVNTITYELRSAQSGENPEPPECNNVGEALGFQWPQPTETELENLEFFLDILAAKEMKIFLRLTNTRMDEVYWDEAETWLGSIISTIVNHPALELILFEGDRQAYIPDEGEPWCGGQAEPPLWNGLDDIGAKYIKFALEYGNSLGMPYRNMSAQSVIGNSLDHLTIMDPTGEMYGSWFPPEIMKGIFDELKVSEEERTYAISFYQGRRCKGVEDIGIEDCIESSPHEWADETLARLKNTIGEDSEARIIGVEMGLDVPVENDWTLPQAIPSIFELVNKYQIEGGSIWIWVQSDTDTENNPDNVKAIKVRGEVDVFNPVKKVLEEYYLGP